MPVPYDIEALIERLGLEPHPEGGWYRETFRDTHEMAGRSVSTAIYYLLGKDDRSRWHRVDAAEVWHYYAGAPLELSTIQGESVVRRVLGPGFAEGQMPQLVVPAQTWQSARSLGPWTLAGCTVAPGFVFEGFEIAGPDFAPPQE